MGIARGDHGHANCAPDFILMAVSLCPSLLVKLKKKDLELVEHRRKSLGVYLKALLDNRLMHTDRRCRQLIYWFLHDTDKFKVRRTFAFERLVDQRANKQKAEEGRDLNDRWACSGICRC